MLDYLPNNLLKELSKCFLGLNEIRIRKDCPVVVKIDGKNSTLNKIILSSKDIEDIIFKICKGSIHAYDDQIVNGYVTDSCGIRVGLSGEFVVKNGIVQAIRKISSLCFRIPNAINGVSDEFFNKIYKGGSVLVVSPPGVGKTSFIRDLINNICKTSLKNLVIVDERNEIAMKTKDNKSFLSENVDVLTYASKEYGFNQAVRTLNPDVIVTDELTNERDVNSIVNAIYGGVSVIATVHGSSIESLLLRSYMKNLKSQNVFDYIVLIKLNGESREYVYYDKNFHEICLF